MRTVTKRDNSRRIAYLYDSQGNRTVKTVTTRQTDGTDRVTSTYYVRDAQGNVLSVYERVVTAATPNASITQSEIYLYGSSRLGVYKPRANRSVATNGIYSRSLRLKEYELTDHLGNVRAVVGDYRQSDGANPVRVALLRYYNQYAFGLDMPLMTWQGTGGGYRYGYNGKEMDKDFANNYDYGFRIYNPGIAKFLSVDPMAKSFPELTPYQFASNTPIMAVDLDGKESEWYVLEYAEKNLLGTTFLQNVRKGFEDRAWETVVGTATGLGRSFIDGLQKPGMTTTIADPGIATRQLFGVVQEHIQQVQAIIYVGKEYIALAKEATNGNPKAIGAVAFEAAMFLVPGDEVRFGTKLSGLEFQKLGYVYEGRAVLAAEGKLEITHILKKGAEEIEIGMSEISKSGELFNYFEVPEILQGKGASKAMYQAMEDTFNPETILGAYYKSNDPLVKRPNYDLFMKVYDPIKNNWLEALQATPAYKSTPKGYKVKTVDLSRKDEVIHVIYEKVK